MGPLDGGPVDLSLGEPPWALIDCLRAAPRTETTAASGYVVTVIGCVEPAEHGEEWVRREHCEQPIESRLIICSAGIWVIARQPELFYNNYPASQPASVQIVLLVY